jgi:DNA-binding HxlR family transcriptional regulator
MMVSGTGAEVESAGARTLTLLAAPLTAAILDELAQGSRRLVELRRGTGAPPQTTLRARVKQLIDVDALARRRLHLFPSVREHILTNGAGTELRFVADTLRRWLAAAPNGGLELGAEPAQAAVKALAEAWSVGMLRPIAERPQTTAELEKALEPLPSRSLERRLLALEDAGLIETASSGDRLAYMPTEWLRRATAPLSAAVRWEGKHAPELGRAIGPAEAEVALLLAVPLLRLPAELSGSCRLGVEFGDGRDRRLVGVTAEIDRGSVASVSTRLPHEADASATGPARAWLRAAIEADSSWLDLAGDARLGSGVVDGINRALFPPRLL